MAVIGRIRKRVGLLIGFVGVSMILFILGDLVTSNTGLMNRNSDVVGVISGEKVRHSEFEKRVETLTENYKLNTKTENVDQNTQDMLRDQAWNMFINDNTLTLEYKKLGLSCSPEELFYMCTGPNPHPQIRQAFTDPKTGQYDPNNVIKFLKDLPNRDENTQRQWKQFEDAIRDERLGSKYKDLIKSSLFITSEEAKRAYIESQRLATIGYLRLDYNTIADTAAKVGDDEMESYYNENKSKYKQTETVRKLEYVTFDVTPSSADRQMVMDWVVKKKDEFAQTNNDTVFVNLNSDNPFDSSLHAKGSLPPVLDTIMFSASVGTIIGPYEEGEFVKVSKLNSSVMVPDSVKARHILVKIQNNDTTKAMHMADSLKNLIKKGTDFAMLAMKHSEDPGSGMKGGDLGWFRQGAMVKPFNDACFQGKKGDLPIIISDFGVHLIQIVDKGTPSKQVVVGTVTRKIEPSQKTYDDIFNKANLFAAANRTGEAFDSSCIKQGLNKRIADNIKESDKNIPGLEQPRELIRWAYGADKGEVSKAYTLNDKYVIAHLTNIKEKGILPMEEVQEQVKAGAIKEKKAKLLMEKITNAGTGSIETIAQKLNMTVTEAASINFANPYITGIGNEPQFVGAIFGMKKDQLSKPMKGENSVAIFVVKSFTEPPATLDYALSMKQVLEQRKSRSEYEVFNALKEKAKIEDNRGRFY